MDRPEKEPRRANPFVLGLIGLGLTLAGYALMAWRLQPAGRGLFWVGVAVVACAAVVWYRQAQETGPPRQGQGEEAVEAEAGDPEP